MSKLTPLALLALLAIGTTLVPGPAAAQVGGSWSYDEHVCGDCHGAHPQNPLSTLIRRGTSQLSGQASGISLTSVRCLECHGIESDRLGVKSDRPVPTVGATYLGPVLNNDHELGGGGGNVRALMSARSRWDFGGEPRAGAGIALGPGNVQVNCTSCHDPHRAWEVTEQTELLDATCLACHDQDRNQGDHRQLSCGVCHKLHNAPSELFRESNRDNVCGACHIGAPIPLNPGIEPVPGPPVHSSPSGSCQSCHEEH